MNIKIQKQSGITLIELMIALLIGAIMLTGVIAVFVNSSKTNRVLTNLSRIQEDTRFVGGTIKKTLSLIGYRRDSRIEKTAVFKTLPQSVYGSFFTPMMAGQSIAGLDNQTTTAGITEDQIYFRYQNDDTSSALNCLGESFVNPSHPSTPTLLADTTIGNHYYIADKGKGRNLYCDSMILPEPIVTILPSGTTFTSIKAVPIINSEPLVSNVEKFQVLYGMFNPSVGNEVINEYVTCYRAATSVSTSKNGACSSGGVNFQNVLIVRINMIISTKAKNLTYDNEKHDFTYAGMTITDVDKKLYQGLTLDIALNNQIL